MNKKYHNKYKQNTNYKRHIIRFGLFGIKSLTAGRLTEVQLNILLRSINKNLKLISKSAISIKFWNMILMNSTLTSLNPESRMGKGKGLVCTKSCYIKPGQILFEFSGISIRQITLICTFLQKKLPLKIKIC